MGKVNVVLPGGRVVSVDEADAAQGTFRQESAGEGEQRATGDLVQQNMAGPVNTAMAGIMGAADTFSLGLAGRVAGAVGGEGASQDFQDLARAHPIAHGVGSAAAMLAPTGWLGDGAKAVGEATGLGLAAHAGEALGGGAVGRIAEGAILGVGAEIADSNVTGDPLTIEGTLASAGIGGVLNYGFGLVGDKLKGMGAKAQAAKAEAEEFYQTVEKAREGAKLFSEETPEWAAFKESVDAAQSARAKIERAEEAQRKAYNDFAGSNKKLTASIKKAEDVVNEVSSRWGPVMRGGDFSPEVVAEAANGGPIDGGFPQGVRDQAADFRAPDQYVPPSSEAGTNPGRPAVQMEGPPGGDFSSSVKAAAEEAQPQEFSPGVKAEARGARRGLPGGSNRGRYTPSQEGDFAPGIRAEAANPEFSNAIRERAGNGDFPPGVRARAAAAEAADGAPADFSASVRDRAASGDFAGGVRDAAPSDHLSPVVDERPPVGLSDQAPPPAGRQAKLPMPEHLSDRLAEWRGRISDMYKIKGGGWELNGQGYWVKNPAIKADPVKALEELRSLANDMMAENPKASGLLNDLPKVPPPPKPYIKPVEMPGSIRDFAKMKPETIERLSNSLSDDSAVEFAKLANTLGVEIKEDPAATVAGVHKKLGEYIGALEKVAAQTGKGAKAPSFVGMLRKMAGNMAAGAAGFGAFKAVGGGMVGAAAGAAARVGARAGMNAIEDNLLGGTLMAQKAGVRKHIQDVIAKYAGKTGEAVIKMGPATSYLSQSLISGEKDPEKDPRKLAVNRMHEIATAQLSAPDAMFLAMEPLMGHTADLAYKFAAGVTHALGYLHSIAPKDPGIDTKMFSSEWSPAWHDTVAFAHAYGAVLHPHEAIDRALAGDGHPAATDALWAVYPAHMDELAQEVSMSANLLANASYAEISNYSDLFRRPMSPMQEPQVVTMIQGMYLPKPQQPQGGEASGGPGGRPPAVQSKVAGSSVSNLIA